MRDAFPRALLRFVPVETRVSTALRQFLVKDRGSARPLDEVDVFVSRNLVASHDNADAEGSISVQNAVNDVLRDHRTGSRSKACVQSHVFFLETVDDIVSIRATPASSARTPHGRQSAALFTVRHMVSNTAPREVRVVSSVIVGGLGAPGGVYALDDDFISRRHLEIRNSAGIVSIRDLGSANGTQVGATRVGHDWFRIMIGDDVTVGHHSLSFAALTD
jgi:hypothetical protein